MRTNPTTECYTVDTGVTPLALHLYQCLNSTLLFLGFHIAGNLTFHFLVVLMVLKDSTKAYAVYHIIMFRAGDSSLLSSPHS